MAYVNHLLRAPAEDRLEDPARLQQFVENAPYDRPGNVVIK